VDDTIGYLIEKLEREGLLKNMNVIIVSDHGIILLNTV
jgi:arylsulfatase A-like enzyme